MTDDERRTLLANLQASSAEAKSLSKEEARKRLIEEGFLDTSGKLSPSYGGIPLSRGESR